MKKSEDYTFGSFFLSLGLYLALSIFLVTIFAPMLFEAAHKQMAKIETEAAERVAFQATQNFMRE
ncbi:hypothetical protein KAR91_60140 [Candidatus Pacearchaeota archaeon]|nr:hypothetical protein [Candidatus Pacearchaeota archaeon]